MEKTYKPGGYNSISPYFAIDGAQKFIDFLQKLFGATILRRFDGENGRILHVELQIDDTVIMVGDASDRFAAIHQLVHLYVPDVDDVFKNAKNLGCEILDPPRERPGDPDRRGAFRDFAGNYWSVATQVKNS